MTLTITSATTKAIRLRGLIGLFMLFFLLSGCGLIMDNEDRLDRGQQSYENADYRAAIIDAKDVLRDEPDNLRGRLLLARASVEVGDGPAAEKEYRKALELGASANSVAVGMGRALLLQRKFQRVLDEVSIEGLSDVVSEVSARGAHADAYLGLNQPEMARQMYTSMLRLEPGSVDAHLGIASSFVAENNFIQARGAIENTLQSNAENPRVWVFSGLFNQRVRDFETAEANFEVALKLAKENKNEMIRLHALGGLAESMLERQKTDEARPLIEQLNVEAPHSYQTKVLTARIAVVDEDWTVAQQNLQQILQVAPNFRPAQLLLGAVHLSSGNLSQAEMYLEAAVASMPDDIRARQLLAETRLQMRKADAAQEALAPVVGQENVDALTLQMAARASLGRDNVDEAIEYLERSVAEDPGNEDLRFQLAVTLLQANRTDEAQEVLNSVDVSASEEHAYRRDALNVLTSIRDNQPVAALAAARKVAADYPDRPAALNLFAAVQLANADTQGAKQSFEQVIAMAPDDVVARRYLGGIAASAGDLEGAQAHYESVISDQPDSAWALTALGKIAFSKGDFESAGRYFRRALDLAPDNVEFRLNVARTERKLGNAEQAAQMLEQDVGTTLENVPSAIVLGTIKAESGDVAAALDIARRLQAQYPDNPVPFAYEGEVYLIAGDLVKADQAYESALAMGTVKGHAIRAYRIKRRLGVQGAERPLLDFLEKRPLDNDVRVFLGESYMQSNDLGKSISTYEHAVSSEPTNAIALNNLAWTYFLANDPRALDTAKKAYEAAPGNGSVVDTLGWIMVQRGDVEQGETLLRKAAQISGDRGEIQYHHAYALARLDRIDEARGILQEILASEENFSSRPDAEQMLAGL